MGSNSQGSTSHTGACHCGAVRFEALGGPVRVGLCHCIDCQKDTGAPFAGFATFPQNRVKFSGKKSVAYQSSTHLTRYFCPTCGSSVFLTESGEDLYYINLGVFDDATRFTPTYEIWTMRKLPWVPEFPGIEGSERE